MTEPLYQVPDDAKWEEDDQILEEGQRKFAKARLYYPLRVDRFQTGQKFTLPGVFYDEFDDATQTSERIGLKEFGPAMTLNPKAKWELAILVTEEFDKNGKPYQRQLKMPVNFNETDQDSGEKHPNLWFDFQRAEVSKLSSKDRVALGKAGAYNKWVYIAYDKTPTGYTGQYDPKSYVANIATYKNEAEWQAANEAHFAQFQNGQTPATSHYPDDWRDVEAMIKWGKEMADKYGKNNYPRIAVQTQLVENGVIAKTANGQECDVNAIVNEMLMVDIPPEMKPKEVQVDVAACVEFSKTNTIEY